MCISKYLKSSQIKKKLVLNEFNEPGKDLA